MGRTTPTPPAESTSPPAALPACGGSYTRDPATGVLTLVEEPTAAAVPGQLDERPDDAEPGVQIDGQGLAPAADAAAEG